MSTYYQPSHRMPPGGVLLTLLGGLLAAAVLALVYIYAVWYIPIVYANFLLCAGFGLGLGLALAWLGRRGRLRSPRGMGVLAVVVGLLALYLQWGVWLTLLFNAETTGTGADADTSTSFSLPLLLDILSHPGAMWEAMLEVNKTGTWSLKGSTPSGLFLGLIWLTEAVVILGCTYFTATLWAGEPYSELADEWAEEETLAQPVRYAHDAAATRAALEAGRFDDALTPHLEATDLGQFAHLKLHCAPNDPSCAYLSYENITKSLDKKGKPEHKTQPVVQYLAVSPATVQALRSRFGAAGAPGIVGQ
jgi:hypothetical protein